MKTSAEMRVITSGGREAMHRRTAAAGIVRLAEIDAELTRAARAGHHSCVIEIFAVSGLDAVQYQDMILTVLRDAGYDVKEFSPVNWIVSWKEVQR